MLMGDRGAGANVLVTEHSPGRGNCDCQSEEGAEPSLAVKPNTANVRRYTIMSSRASELYGSASPTTVDVSRERFLVVRDPHTERTSIMRADMAKVIVERPRRGGDRSRKGRSGAIEFFPTKEGMKRRWIDHKSLNENLAPLRRFLASRVGRRWDAVYGEINEHLAVRNAVQQHVRTHIGWFVALHLEVAPDSTLYDHGWRGANWRDGYDLYVDPRDGILKRARSDKAYRREAQQRRQERLAARASRADRAGATTRTAAYQRRLVPNRICPIFYRWDFVDTGENSQCP